MSGVITLNGFHGKLTSNSGSNFVKNLILFAKTNFSQFLIWQPCFNLHKRDPVKEIPRSVKDSLIYSIFPINLLEKYLTPVPMKVGCLECGIFAGVTNVPRIRGVGIIELFYN